MRYVRFEHGGTPRFGVEWEQYLVDVARVATALGLEAAVAAVLDDRSVAPEIGWLAAGGNGLDVARSVVEALADHGDDAARIEGVVPTDGSRRLAPIARPGKIVAVGRNYADHCLEQNQELPAKPLFFIKLATAVIGDGDAIRFDREATSRVDYEAELAVVIGRRGRDIAVNEAMQYVAGYTVVNDVTARDLQKADKQWSRAKGLDTFCPMGPCIVTADEVDNPHDLNVRSFVNGEPRQSSNTRHLIFDIPTLIHRLSQSVTLEPGDVLPTGTPGGVGCYLDPPVFLGEGDTVEVEVEGVGRLRNPVHEISPATA